MAEVSGNPRLFQGNLACWNIVIWPDGVFLKKPVTSWLGWLFFRRIRRTVYQFCPQFDSCFFSTWCENHNLLYLIGHPWWSKISPIKIPMVWFDTRSFKAPKTLHPAGHLTNRWLENGPFDLKMAISYLKIGQFLLEMVIFLLKNGENPASYVT